MKTIGQDRYVSLNIIVEKKSKMLTWQNTNNFFCYKTNQKYASDQKHANTQVKFFSFQMKYFHMQEA
jgi:hypothetical protein